jgi:hypothetical protein
MQIRQDLVDLVGDEELLFADGFDNAIIGVDVVNNRVVYSYGKMLEILILEDMTEEDAIEHLEFNVVNAYVGERTPIYIYEVESVAGRII